MTIFLYTSYIFHTFAPCTRTWPMVGQGEGGASGANGHTHCHDPNRPSFQVDAPSASSFPAVSSGSLPPAPASPLPLGPTPLGTVPLDAPDPDPSSSSAHCIAAAPPPTPDLRARRGPRGAQSDLDALVLRVLAEVPEGREVGAVATLRTLNGNLGRPGPPDRPNKYRWVAVDRVPVLWQGAATRRCLESMGFRESAAVGDGRRWLHCPEGSGEQMLNWGVALARGGTMAEVFVLRLRWPGAYVRRVPSHASVCLCTACLCQSLVVIHQVPHTTTNASLSATPPPPPAGAKVR